MGDRFASTAGFLDGLAVEGDRLAASGWTASLDPAEVSEVRLAVGDRQVECVFSGFQPSPDVRAAYPTVRGTEKCRFALQASLDGDSLERIARREVISITPYVDGRPGVPMERIWPLALPAAHAADSTEVGHGDFVETSFSFLALFRLLAGLTREESILDAGCGIGRMAFALSHYLGRDARYEGFDVSKRFVEMARARYADLPNFRFQHADIFNRMYNPKGKRRASEFTFPFADRTFSFTFLTSVFTHMLPGDVSGYLREIRRTLRADGRCLATFFILDEEAERLMGESRARQHFAHRQADGCLVENLRVPENAVAYREGHLREMILDAGLRIEQIHRGSWSGRPRFLSYQDVCVLRPLS